MVVPTFVGISTLLAGLASDEGSAPKGRGIDGTERSHDQRGAGKGPDHN